jgi:hypothetical protein
MPPSSHWPKRRTKLMKLNLNTTERLNTRETNDKDAIRTFDKDSNNATSHEEIHICVNRRYPLRGHQHKVIKSIQSIVIYISKPFEPRSYQKAGSCKECRWIFKVKPAPWAPMLAISHVCSQSLCLSRRYWLHWNPLFCNWLRPPTWYSVNVRSSEFRHGSFGY